MPEPCEILIHRISNGNVRQRELLRVVFFLWLIESDKLISEHLAPSNTPLDESSCIVRYFFSKIGVAFGSILSSSLIVGRAWMCPFDRSIPARDAKGKRWPTLEILYPIRKSIFRCKHRSLIAKFWSGSKWHLIVESYVLPQRPQSEANSGVSTSIHWPWSFICRSTVNSSSFWNEVLITCKCSNESLLQEDEPVSRCTPLTL